MIKNLRKFGYIAMGMGAVFFGWRDTLHSTYASIGLGLLAFLLIACADILEDGNH